MVLLAYSLLALIPLLGVAYIVVYGSPFTVDGLFLSLILLAISGVFGTTALFDLRNRSSAPAQGSGTTPLPAAGPSPTGAVVQRGRVQSVQFFESNVGQPNKSIVTLDDGTASARTLVLEGDLRNALPAGQLVEVTFRKQAGANVLLNVSYS
jgi:hypothetical protein